MPRLLMKFEEGDAYEIALRRLEDCGENGTELDLSGLGLMAIPPNIFENTKLIHLDLSGNQLTNLPPQIGQMSGLRTLDLSRAQLTALPPEIGQLTDLTTLILSNNQLTALPPEIGKLTALTSLDVHNNQLTALPPEIGRLVALTRLGISWNAITALPPEIGKLTALDELFLSGNRLTALPPEIGQLKSLTVLWLPENDLTTLPPEIGQLKMIKEVCLHGNELTTLPKEIQQLTTLTHFFLHENAGLRFPLEVLGPEYVEVFDDEESDVAPANPADIIDYYLSICGRDGQALREVKLILVGRGEVGKSTLADLLRGLPFTVNRDRTDGINITPWPVQLRDGEAELKIWDFGGQEIMHGTHQFFLTHRSLYIVVVDGRHDRAKQDAEYWLKLVRAFGGESPVMVVMNRQNAYPFDMDRQFLADKYGVKLGHFFRTDCERNKDIEPVRRAILAETERMLEAEELFPKKCWDVKVRLEAMKVHGEDYLSDQHFATVCTEHGVGDAADQSKLLRRLADIGTVVSFPDDLKLAEFSVLNPEWATDGIYRVMTNEALREEKHGQLKCAELRSLLPQTRWPDRRHLQYLQDLMEKFELCFRVDGVSEDTVLVPELLPDVTPPLKEWNAKQCVVFQYRYTVLPHGVLPRFITRTHALSLKRERWRTGVVLEDDGAEALVKADYDANTITIWVRGGYADARRALLKVSRHHFDTIHSRIKDLNPVEEVGIPGHPEVLVPYADVVQDERDGKFVFRVTVDGARRDWDIRHILNGVESMQEREKKSRLAKREMQGRNIIVKKGGHYHEREETMSQQDSHDITIHGNVTNAQVGQTLRNCTNMIQQQPLGERKDLLQQLERETNALIEELPEEKREMAVGDLEQLIKGATASTPNRRWYSVSAEGLLEASKYVKDFSGNIAGTISNLGKTIWSDFVLPEMK